MLSELYIKNFALIEELRVGYGGGFNVITGETGAGKTIIIEAIKLLLGSRATGEYIRTGEETALVEAVFQLGLPRQAGKLENLLEENGTALSEDGMLILTRELSSTGKNVCRLDRRVIPLGLLKELGPLLIELHSQGQQQELARPTHHLEILDQMGGGEIARLKQDLSRLYHHRGKLTQEIKKIYLDEEEKAKKLDFLKYQVEEIQGVALSPGEEESLREEKNRLDNLEKLLSGMAFIYEEVYGGYKGPSVVEKLGRAQKELEALLGYDSSLEPAYASLEETLPVLSELGLDCKTYLDNLSFDPGRLEEIDQRLDVIKSLKRKYGPTLEDIISFGERAAGEIEDLKRLEVEIQGLVRQREQVEAEMEGLARGLTTLRKETAARLEKQVSGILNRLEMPGARFQVQFDQEEKFTPRGRDRVGFLFSSNPGEPLKPLAKIASGGEMSRIMLALRTVLARSDDISTIIFDEIDVGTGGVSAQSMADQLLYISRFHQVICVSHSSQVASLADSHYAIYKESREGRTRTRIKRLSTQERTMEIARMISGADTTEITLKHAEEILAKKKGRQEGKE